MPVKNLNLQCFANSACSIAAVGRSNHFRGKIDCPNAPPTCSLIPLVSFLTLNFSQVVNLKASPTKMVKDLKTAAVKLASATEAL